MDHRFQLVIDLTNPSTRTVPGMGHYCEIGPNEPWYQTMTNLLKDLAFTQPTVAHQVSVCGFSLGTLRTASSKR